MAYDKLQLQEAGAKLVDLILAISDGVGADDLEEGSAFLVSLVGCFDELSGDTDAALFHLLGAAADHYADFKRDEQAGDPVVI
mgnify:CR=1 FL=1